MLYDTLKFLVPEAQFVIVGEPTTEAEYLNNVVWHDERSQPSWSDVQGAKPSVEAALALQAVIVARHNAYVAEADSLFFKWQRNEGTQEAWLDKVAEIRARYPDPS